MILEQERLKAITINGLDAVLVLINLSIEIISAVSPTDEEAENRLTDLANKLEGFARLITDPRMNLLMKEIARGLIATERTT